MSVPIIIYDTVKNCCLIINTLKRSCHEIKKVKFIMVKHCFVAVWKNNVFGNQYSIVNS